MNELLAAAGKLHRYLVARHWTDEGLIGPDPGIRVNYRLGRFVKSYLGRWPWSDDLYYLQAQGYWTLANWRLFTGTRTAACRRIAIRCSETMLARQRPDGAWEYPNPEWKGRIATAEGTWAALGLLESYRQTAQKQFLDGALRWYECLCARIGFRQHGGGLAVNYFAGRPSNSEPNSSAFVLRFLAELAMLSGEASPRRHCPGLLRFLESAQTPSGEFPYEIPGPFGAARHHFQCYQYNAFMALDLMRYFELVGEDLPAWMGRLAAFLRAGIAADGHACYACGNRHRAVTYHAAVLAAALQRASDGGLADCRGPADRASAWLIGRQRADGSFPYSRGDYRVLRDERSYPRYLAMILFHLLMLAPPSQREREPASREAARR